jgi:hypothetical protein
LALIDQKVVTIAWSLVPMPSLTYHYRTIWITLWKSKVGPLLANPSANC